MPIYSYICNKCGAEFDLLIGVTGKDEAKSCKKCGSKKIERVLTSFGVSISPGKNTSGLSCPGCPAGGCGLN